MNHCKYYDCGWCYAPKNVETNAVQGGCFEPEYCPYTIQKETRQTGKTKFTTNKILRKVCSKEMTKITRIEVIDENGRSYVNWEEDNDVSYQLQDDGRTLKVFVNKVKPKSPAEEAYKRWMDVYPPTGPSADGIDEIRWRAFQMGYNASKEEKVSEWKPTPQTPEQVADGLKEAFREAVKQGVVSKAQERGERVHRGMEKLIEEIVENPPEFLKFELGQSLYDLIADWWDEIFTNGNPSGQNIESLIDHIEHWFPKEQSASGSQNAYVECAVEGFNDCLKKIKSKLRNKQ